MLKFAFVAMLFLSLFPIALLIRQYAWLTRLFWLSFGALPFLLSSAPFLDVGIASWEDWHGFVSGIEVTVIDLLALIALFILPAHRTPVIYFLPFALYIVVGVGSAIAAPEPLAATFALWQFGRMLLIMAVVARACAFRDVPDLILKGMVLGLLANFLAVLWQRFGLDLAQNTGLFIHQNTLGMAIHFILLPHVIMLLAGTKRLTYLGPTILLSLLTIIFTASRGSVGSAAIGMATAFGFSAMQGVTQRKVASIGAALVVVALAAPVVVATFEKRFERAPLNEEAYDERAAFNSVSAYILEDFPMGIGLNHYVYAAQNFGYSDRGGVLPFEANRRAIVHNAYLLAAAETGYLGLAAFILVLITPLAVGLRTGIRIKNRRDSAILIGCVLALIIVYLHSVLEWIIYSKEIQYMMVITMGIIFGVSSKYLRSANRKIPLENDLARKII